MIAYFLEYVPENFASGNTLIIALTPAACFELDERGIEYQVPDDFVSPENVFIEQHIQEIEEVSSSYGKTFCDAMSLCFYEKGKTRIYWEKFLLVFKERYPDLSVVYVGKNLKLAGMI